MKFKKEDHVIVTSGKDKGKKGKIEKIFPKENKVIIGGVNQYKRHLKPRGEKKPGGIIDITKPLPVSNIALICTKCNQKTRIGYKFEGGEKIRICRKCEQSI